MTSYLGNPHDSPVWQEIADERDRQDAKWGEQNHGAAVWVAVLAEEVGEFAEAALTYRTGRDIPLDVSLMRAELIQVAAVAIETIEWIDRGRPIDHTQSKIE